MTKKEFKTMSNSCPWCEWNTHFELFLCKVGTNIKCCEENCAPAFIVNMHKKEKK
jgi:hypothetical protein